MVSNKSAVEIIQVNSLLRVYYESVLEDNKSGRLVKKANNHSLLKYVLVKNLSVLTKNRIELERQLQELNGFCYSDHCVCAKTHVL
jgi:hypothetical protein